VLTITGVSFRARNRNPDLLAAPTPPKGKGGVPSPNWFDIRRHPERGNQRLLGAVSATATPLHFSVKDDICTFDQNWQLQRNVPYSA
jgi:hypothetical protein